MARERRSNGGLLGAVLLIALLWRGAGAALDSAAELGSLSPSELAVAITGDRGARVRLTAGREHDLLAAVLEHVPEEEPLFVLGELELERQLEGDPGSIRAKEVYSLLYALAAPRPVFAATPPEVARAVTSYAGERAAWVADLGARVDFDWSAFFETVASGEGFALRRWKGNG